MSSLTLLLFLLFVFGIKIRTVTEALSLSDGSSAFFSIESCNEDNRLLPNRQLPSSEVTAPLLNSQNSRKIMNNGEPIRILTSSLAPIIVVKWNSSGPVVNLTGYAPYMIDLIAKRADFQYCWVPLGRDIPFDDAPGRKGLIGHAVDDRGDLIVATLVRTTERLKLVDFTPPTTEGPFSIMIPFPEITINSNALVQPFQFEVWINLLVATIFVIMALYFFTKASNHFTKQRSANLLESDGNHHHQVKLYDTFTYVITILLTQGNFYANQKMASHFVAGAWCLGALILVSAYSGTLLSFIMSPVRKPVIESIYDIVHVPGLKVALDRGRAADMQLESNGQDKSTNFGKTVSVIQKTIFRCNTSKECTDKVLAGDYVYIHGKPAVNQMIINDLELTGKCRFSEAKESFLNGFLAWGVPKKSPFSSAINNAILELDAFGLSQLWKARFTKIAKKCVNPEEPLRISRLSLSQLSGTFLLLGVGYSLGLFVFLIEKSIHFSKTRRDTASKIRVIRK